MAYKIMARYYSSPDCFGESYVITSDNSDLATMFNIGEKVEISRSKEPVIGAEPQCICTGHGYNKDCPVHN